MELPCAYIIPQSRIAFNCGFHHQALISWALLDDAVKDENDRITGHVPTPRHRKPGPKKKDAKKAKKAADENNTNGRGKPGPKKGYKRSALNADGTERKKPGPKPGFKRGRFNKDGSVRQKPGPKPKEKTAKDAVT